ncbi:hypothetical protein PTKIN_Ptkin05aG0108600 [Pterospermum kingtungense]
MPESYFDNLIQAIFTVMAAGLLLANPPKFGTSMFKDDGINYVAIGSSPRFKVYDVDFGWGKLEGVRSGSNNKFDGMVYLYQGKSGGRSIDVEITLELEAMEKLEKDKEFLMEV